MRHLPRPLLVAAALLSAPTAVALASDEEAHHPAAVEPAGEAHAGVAVEVGHEHHAGPPPFRLGVFGMGVPAFELHTGLHVDGPTAGAGGGLFFKWEATRAVTLALVAHVLDVPSHHALELPIDLLVEFPFHLTERVHLYLAVGLTAQPLVRLVESEEGTHVSLGVVGGGGMEYWLARRVAVFAEVDLAYLRTVDTEESALEPSGSAGVLFAFGR